MASALFAFVLRIFFRRLEIAGLERLPATGPAILVLNHPSALIDPLFVLSLLPRPASFLAKAPLFKMPIIGAIVRSFGSIPVYRKQDGADPAQNRATIDAARRTLCAGGVIAIFPEGTSHNEPHLLPLKTGAARIALGAAPAQGEPLRIVPAGLTFASKATFRSDALLFLGESFAVAPAPLDEHGEPPAQAVHELTARIDEALATVVLQADREEALSLVARAERIFSSAEADPGTLASQFELRRRFLDGWSRLRELAPDRLAHAERRVRRHEAILTQAGLEPELLDPKHFRPANVVRVALQALLVLGVLLPLALVGIALHAPAWFLIDTLARRLAKGDASLPATLKVLGGLLFYPLTWTALGVAISWHFGIAMGWLAVLVGGVCGFAALRFLERLDAILGGARGLLLFLFRRRAFERLARERDALRTEILALAQWVERATPPA